MMKEPDAKPHGQTLSSVPTTPSPKPSEPLTGVSSNDLTTSRKTRRLNDPEKNKQKEIRDLLRQFVDLFPGNKPIKVITIVFTLLLTLVGDGYVGYLAHQYGPQPLPTPTPTAKFSTHLVDVDMDGYCTSLNYTVDSEQGRDNYCYSILGNTDLDAACNSQYPGNSGLRFKFSDPSNLKSGGCYPPQGSSRGGVNLNQYCISLHPEKGGAPLSAIINNTWACQIKVDMIAACSWQNNEHNIQARINSQDQWSCYGS